MPKTKNIIAELPQSETVEPRAVLDLWRSGGTDLVCVLGPTASGKTRYAVGLARAIQDCPGGPRCEIISADSRQIFRGMDIGTGKDLSEYGDIPYHLIDIADPGEPYNVHRYQQDFRAAAEDIRSRGALPILCGGTGLYINAVTSASYSFDGQRRPLSGGADYGTTFFIGTLVSREVRNARIDARLDARLQEGLVEEIRGLLEKGVGAQTLIAYGLEYKFVTQYVLGELDFGQMRGLLATAIHQFAKRQMTWVRGMERSGATVHWVQP